MCSHWPGETCMSQEAFHPTVTEMRWCVRMEAAAASGDMCRKSLSWVHVHQDWAVKRLICPSELMWGVSCLCTRCFSCSKCYHGLYDYVSNHVAAKCPNSLNITSPNVDGVWLLKNLQNWVASIVYLTVLVRVLEAFSGAGLFHDLIDRPRQYLHPLPRTRSHSVQELLIDQMLESQFLHLLRLNFEAHRVRHARWLCMHSFRRYLFHHNFGFFFSSDPNTSSFFSRDSLGFFFPFFVLVLIYFIKRKLILWI